MGRYSWYYASLPSRLLALMSDKAIKVLRYAIPAIAGTILGIYLEHYVWKGRGSE